MSFSMDDDLRHAVPEGLVSLERYPLLESRGRAAVVEHGRRQLAESGCAVFPGFVPPKALAAMVSDAEAARVRAYRRDMQLPPYDRKPGPDTPSDHPLRRTSPYKMFLVAADLLPPECAVLRLYQWDGLTELVADVLREPVLYRAADPMLNCALTYMAEGDQHGWHFDDNDFVVSLLLQSAESGGDFEFAPRIRDGTDENYAEVAKVMDETSPRTLRLAVEAGTLMIFCGKRALHRVRPVRGARQRIIALLSYDRTPDLQFSKQVRLNTTGRTEALPHG